MESQKTKKLKEILNNILLNIHVLPVITAFRTFITLEISQGHFKSVYRWQSIGAEGLPVPWFTYPSIEYLKSLNLMKKSVFEYGSGNSTLYWAKNAKSVVSVEHDENWYNQIKGKITKHKNASLIFVSGADSYAEQVNKYKKKFDIIVIDGLHREKCAKASIKRLSSGGLLILDNSERYQNICSYLRTQGLIQINFAGFGPINPYIFMTSLFLSKKFKPDFRTRK